MPKTSNDKIDSNHHKPRPNKQASAQSITLLNCYLKNIMQLQITVNVLHLFLFTMRINTTIKGEL